MKHITSLLFSLLILFLPSQLGIHFWPSFSFVHGIRVDYLSPTLYFTDILVLSLFILEWRSLTLPWKYIFGFVLLSSLNIFFAVVPLLTFYKWIKIAELLLLARLVSVRWNSFIDIIVSTLPFSLLWTNTLALLQFVNGGSLNGVWYWLGERTFSTNTPDIALSKLFESVLLRPYATFPHPNALAGYLLVSILLLFTYKKKIHYFWIVTLYSLFIFLLCESYSAVIALVCALIFWIFESYTHFSHRLLSKILVIEIFLFSLISPIFLESTKAFLPFNFSERVDLSLVALRATSAHIFSGSGLGSFITQLPDSLRRGTSLLLQPVHNVYLLFFSETGLLGLLFLSTGIMSLSLTLPLVAILTISLFDHYWFTLQSPSLFLAIIIAFSYNQRSKI